MRLAQVSLFFQFPSQRLLALLLAIVIATSLSQTIGLFFVSCNGTVHRLQPTMIVCDLLRGVGVKAYRFLFCAMSPSPCKVSLLLGIHDLFFEPVRLGRDSSPTGARCEQEAEPVQILTRRGFARARLLLLARSLSFLACKICCRSLLASEAKSSKRSSSGEEFNGLGFLSTSGACEASPGSIRSRCSSFC